MISVIFALNRNPLMAVIRQMTINFGWCDNHFCGNSIIVRSSNNRQSHIFGARQNERVEGANAGRLLAIGIHESLVGDSEFLRS